MRACCTYLCYTFLFQQCIDRCLGPVYMDGMFYGEDIQTVDPSTGRWSSAVHSF